MKLLRNIFVFMLLLTVSSAVVAFLYFDQESQQLNARTRADSGASFVTLPQGTVHYELAGPLAGELVVLVHGFSVPSYLWDPTFEVLVASGYRVLRFDLFGRGLSDRPDTDYDMALFADQLHGLITALDISQPFNLVGLSMGGPIVTLFSNQHPAMVKRLVLEDPVVFPPAAEDISPLDLPLIGEYLAAVYFIPQLADGQKNDFKNQQLFPHWGQRFRVQMQYKGFRRAILSTIRQLVSADTLAQYKTLGQSELPIQVFWGRDDATIPLAHSKTLMQLLPNARLSVIDDAGHIVHLEKSEEFNTLLLRFLATNQS